MADTPTTPTVDGTDLAALVRGLPDAFTRTKEALDALVPSLTKATQALAGTKKETQAATEATAKQNKTMTEALEVSSVLPRGFGKVTASVADWPPIMQRASQAIGVFRSAMAAASNFASGNFVGAIAFGFSALYGAVEVTKAAAKALVEFTEKGDKAEAFVRRLSNMHLLRNNEDSAQAQVSGAQARNRIMRELSEAREQEEEQTLKERVKRAQIAMGLLTEEEASTGAHGARMAALRLEAKGLEDSYTAAQLAGDEAEAAALEERQDVALRAEARFINGYQLMQRESLGLLKENLEKTEQLWYAHIDAIAVARQREVREQAQSNEIIYQAQVDAYDATRKLEQDARDDAFETEVQAYDARAAGAREAIMQAVQGAESIVQSMAKAFFSDKPAEAMDALATGVLQIIGQMAFTMGNAVVASGLAVAAIGNPITAIPAGLALAAIGAAILGATSGAQEALSQSPAGSGAAGYNGQMPDYAGAYGARGGGGAASTRNAGGTYGGTQGGPVVNVIFETGSFVGGDGRAVGRDAGLLIHRAMPQY